MPPPLSVFQHARLSGYIESIKDSKKKNIAKNIYKNYWNLLTISSTDMLFNIFLVPALLSSPSMFLFSYFMKDQKEWGLLVWMFSWFLLVMLGDKYSWFTAKKLIENMPEKKKEFENLIIDPEIKEIYEEMRRVFNDG